MPVGTRYIAQWVLLTLAILLGVVRLGDEIQDLDGCEVISVSSFAGLTEI